MKRISKFILLCLVLGATACEMLFVPEPDNNPEAIFENFWQAFKDDYALFDERNIDWDDTYRQFRPLVNAQTTFNELYDIFTSMIAPMEDGHVALMAPHYGAFEANSYFRERTGDELFNLSVIRNYLAPGFIQFGSHYIYGLIKDQPIAYIHFDVFRPASVKLNQVLTQYPEAQAYIIDLRHNSGGDVSHSFSFLGRFTDRSKLFLRSKTKSGPGSEDYDPWFDWYLKNSGTVIDKPLVVITDRYTVSAAERMVMAARTLPRVTIVGDTTNGTFGTKISRELPNGWYFSYSIQKVQMFNGKSYEGMGLPPDVPVKNEWAEIENGIDRTLQTAIDVAR